MLRWQKNCRLRLRRFRPQGQFLRNAYPPDNRYCQPIERDPLLNRCRKEMSAVLNFMEDGSHRIIFSVNRLDEPIYLIDLSLSDEFRSIGELH